MDIRIRGANEKVGVLWNRAVIKLAGDPGGWNFNIYSLPEYLLS